MKAAIDFACEINAELFGIFVAPQSHYPIYIESVPPAHVTEDVYYSSLKTDGETLLREIQTMAEKEGVTFSGHIVFSDATALSIVRTAHELHCDLIFFGSHGNTGWQNLTLGSVALKVVSIAQLPVLVFQIHENESLP